MAIIPYIHTQLSAWGRWRIRRLNHTAGYPPVSPMFRDAPSGDGYGSAIPIGVSMCDETEMLDLDAAIARLGRDDRQLVVEFYVTGGGSVSIAQRIGVTKKKLYEQLEIMQARLLGLVNDVVAERI